MVNVGVNATSNFSLSGQVFGKLALVGFVSLGILVGSFAVIDETKRASCARRGTVSIGAMNG